LRSESPTETFEQVSQMTLVRGFKAAAERTAASLREELGLRPSDSIDIRTLADHMNVLVVSAETIVDLQRLEEIERIQTFAFSACTFNIEGRSIIVTNPLRHPARQVSDIAHELAHLILGHDLTEIRLVAGVPFRTCRADQEEEATTLGGTILLPRPLLLRAARNNLDVAAIARTYRVTDEMARYRYNTTGIGRQVKASGRTGSTGS
jgi:Zn-dependent peptidase ImmA (M78 family)